MHTKEYAVQNLIQTILALRAHNRPSKRVFRSVGNSSPLASKGLLGNTSTGVLFLHLFSIQKPQVSSRNTLTKTCAGVVREPVQVARSSLEPKLTLTQVMDISTASQAIPGLALLEPLPQVLGMQYISGALILLKYVSRGNIFLLQML